MIYLPALPNTLTPLHLPLSATLRVLAPDPSGRKATGFHNSFRSPRNFAAGVAGSSVAGRLAAGGGSTCTPVVEPGGPGASSRGIKTAREFSALALGIIRSRNIKGRVYKF